MSRPGRAGRRLRGGVVLVAALLGLVAGIAASRTRPPTSVAETLVLVEPLPGNAFSADVGSTLVALETEAQLPRSDAVLTRVAELVGADGPGALRGRVKARLAAGTNVIAVSARAPSGPRAVDLAVTVAEATLVERTVRADVETAARVTWLDGAVAATGRDLSAAALAGEQVRAALLTRRLATLRNELAVLTTAGPVDAGELLGTTAQRDRVAAVVGTVPLVAGPLAGGAAAWAVTAWVAHRRRRSSPVDVVRIAWAAS